MKVVYLSSAGVRTLPPQVTEDRVAFGEFVSRQIMSSAAKTVQVNYSSGRMFGKNQLLASIKRRATSESLQVFQYAVTLIKSIRTINMRTMDTFDFARERRAFSNLELESSRGRPTGRALALERSAAARDDVVAWRDLSPSWVDFKYGTNRANYNKFFMNTGQLARQLENKRRWAAKAGTPEVKASTPRNLSKVQRRDLRFVLDEIEVKIYPNLRPNLIPMLASQRWTTSNNGDFEKQFFRGKMGEKLAGPEGFHRPLMLPLIQFWMAYRIPRSIELAVEDWMKTSARGGA